MSAVVTDTHTLLWYLNDSSKLSARALSALENAERKRLGNPCSGNCPDRTTISSRKGRDIFESDLQLIISNLNSSSSALTFAPLTQSVAEDIENISRPTVPDMPDRLIAATAFSLNLPLVSKDGSIRKLRNVNVVW